LILQRRCGLGGHRCRRLGGTVCGGIARRFRLGVCRFCRRRRLRAGSRQEVDGQDLADPANPRRDRLQQGQLQRALILRRLDLRDIAVEVPQDARVVAGERLGEAQAQPTIVDGRLFELAIGPIEDDAAKAVMGTGAGADLLLPPRRRQYRRQYHQRDQQGQGTTRVHHRRAPAGV